jgi:hypothetical protein
MKSNYVELDEAKLSLEILAMTKGDVEKNLKRARRYQKLLKYIVGNSSFALKESHDKEYRKIVDMNHMIEELITMLNNRLVSFERKN